MFNLPWDSEQSSCSSEHVSVKLEEVMLVFDQWGLKDR